MYKTLKVKSLKQKSLSKLPHRDYQFLIITSFLLPPTVQFIFFFSCFFFHQPSVSSFHIKSVLFWNRRSWNHEASKTNGALLQAGVVDRWMVSGGCPVQEWKKKWMHGCNVAYYGGKKNAYNIVILKKKKLRDACTHPHYTWVRPCMPQLSNSQLSPNNQNLIFLNK